jgi:hypothetical protein
MLLHTVSPQVIAAKTPRVLSAAAASQAASTLDVCLGLQIKEIMTAAEQAMQSQLAGPTIALLDDMPADLWTRLSTRLSSSTAAAAQVRLPVHKLLWVCD